MEQQGWGRQRRRRAAAASRAQPHPARQPQAAGAHLPLDARLQAGLEPLGHLAGRRRLDSSGSLAARCRPRGLGRQGGGAGVRGAGLLMGGPAAGAADGQEDGQQEEGAEGGAGAQGEAALPLALACRVGLVGGRVRRLQRRRRPAAIAAQVHGERCRAATAARGAAAAAACGWCCTGGRALRATQACAIGRAAVCGGAAGSSRRELEAGSEWTCSWGRLALPVHRAMMAMRWARRSTLSMIAGASNSVPPQHSSHSLCKLPTLAHAALRWSSLHRQCAQPVPARAPLFQRAPHSTPTAASPQPPWPTCAGAPAPAS